MLVVNWPILKIIPKYATVTMKIGLEIGIYWGYERFKNDLIININLLILYGF